MGDVHSRRARQLPIDSYEPERMLGVVVVAILAGLAVSLIIWAVRSH
jgi:hypothetical protein